MSTSRLPLLASLCCIIAVSCMFTVTPRVATAAPEAPIEDGAWWMGFQPTLTGHFVEMVHYEGELAIAEEGGSIFEWNGLSWKPLDPEFPLSDIVAMTTLDGRLVVASKDSVLLLNGAWVPLASLNVGDVGITDLEVANGALYVAGDLPHGVYRWDQNQWNSLGSGLRGTFPDRPKVLTLKEYRGGVVAGGEFVEAGGLDVSNLAYWDGSAWSSLGDCDGLVASLGTYNDTLLVGGDFYFVDGLHVNRIAMYDGSDWRAIGSTPTLGTDNIPRAFYQHGDTLIVTGPFSRIGALAVDGVGMLEGGVWSRVPTNSQLMGSSRAYMDIDELNGDLVFCGSMSVARYQPFYHKWTGLGLGFTRGECVTEMQVVNTNTLFISPTYDYRAGSNSWDPPIAGGITFAGPAVWCPDYGWDCFHVPITFDVWDEVLDMAFLANGDVLFAGEVTGQNGVFKLNVFSSSGLQRMCRAFARAILPFGPGLVVGGRFDDVEGEPATGVVYWDGNSWQHMSHGLHGIDALDQEEGVHALELFNGAVVAGGKFHYSGDVIPDEWVVRNIANWDGEQWRPLGGGTDGPVYALLDYSEGLVAGGQFLEAGGQEARNIARWNGSEWTPLGDGVEGRVNCLVEYDGLLVAGGAIREADHTPADGLAVWDGSQWYALPSYPYGSYLTVYDLEVLQGKLFVSGCIGNDAFVGRWDGPLGLVPVGAVDLAAQATDEGVVLTWHANDAGSQWSVFDVYRENEVAQLERLTSQGLQGSESYEYIDRGPVPPIATYWLRERDRSGQFRWHGPVSVETAGNGTSSVAALSVHPNPFLSSVALQFSINQGSRVNITVFDLLGRRVRVLQDGETGPGTHEVNWDGRDDRGRITAPGAYFIRVDSPEYVVMKKAIKLQ